ncbi:hypothetical protein [Mycolicibacterium thermoresistibile]|uniref:Diphosphate--fructose-6-phosphate 1-phosphotransferase n=2 Tax=Mycolicibacterium thermoresistibile TaxID=1797 RepID=G7CGI6_MYCT3|nr:hypothetical protein [Mycolicibacterium thermoresistibile]EHI11946.1 hypothetical protein KEK_13643 [Mycolicibacterium thermoresistibile ATCC 19527]MCV7188976.1 hypothetical protein [Mycolicibacterium thermoresistibile]GAT14838.1 putative uncharacterized protein [Mycolicibacterium thermoresistibile]SNW20061.1 Uncharacterised protein [Mycolicibacterium thermoresistibile]
MRRSTPAAAPAVAGRRDIALDTYRYLRGGMVVMTLMLAAAIVAERLRAGCWLDSISAYYYSAAHNVFIAAVCAIGALLIVYRGGSDTEDTLLNLAGILAFVVAFVPVPPPGTVCGTPLPAAGWDVEIGISVWPLIIALVVSRIASWWLYRSTGTSEPHSTVGAVAMWGQRLVLAVGLVAFVVFREFFDTYAHRIAAVLLFVIIVVTVAITARLVTRQDQARSPHQRAYHRAYRVIAVLMGLTILVVIAIHVLVDGFSHAALIAESALIVQFAAYWLIQTVELWHVRERAELLCGDERSADDPLPGQPNRPEM